MWTPPPEQHEELTEGTGGMVDHFWHMLMELSWVERVFYVVFVLVGMYFLVLLKRKK